MDMTAEQAVEWLQEVNGRLYRTKRKAEKPDSWVAVVRVPSAGTRRGKLIIALGGSAREATQAAESQWQTQWGDLSNIH